MENQTSYQSIQQSSYVTEKNSIQVKDSIYLPQQIEEMYGQIYLNPCALNDLLFNEINEVNRIALENGIPLPQSDIRQKFIIQNAALAIIQQLLQTTLQYKQNLQGPESQRILNSKAYVTEKLMTIIHRLGSFKSSEGHYIIENVLNIIQYLALSSSSQLRNLVKNNESQNYAINSNFNQETQLYKNLLMEYFLLDLLKEDDVGFSRTILKDDSFMMSIAFIDYSPPEKKAFLEKMFLLMKTEKSVQEYISKDPDRLKRFELIDKFDIIKPLQPDNQANNTDEDQLSLDKVEPQDQMFSAYWEQVSKRNPLQGILKVFQPSKQGEDCQLIINHDYHNKDKSICSFSSTQILSSFMALYGMYFGFTLFAQKPKIKYIMPKTSNNDFRNKLLAKALLNP